MMDNVEYDIFTGGSRLFHDYINNFQAIAELYEGDPYAEDSFRAQISNVSKHNHRRTELTEILARQNINDKNTGVVQPLLDKLSDPRSSVVVTGQQAGLFLGPLYTVYKAMTAVKLAEKIESRFDVPVVPVFWIEVDDHDFDEVRNFSVMSPSGEVRKMEYDDGNKDGSLPVWKRKIDDSFVSILNGFSEIFGDTDNSRDTIGALSEIFKTGKSMPEVFREFFREYFPDVPLLFIDPSDPDVKETAKPFFRDIISRRVEVSKALNDQNDGLVSKGYKPQVELREGIVRLFNFNGEERKRLSQDDFGEGEEAVNEFVENNYRGLSGDVLTRPLLQDYLLPTIAYVAGPSELAYMGQLKKLYSLQGLTMPVIYPRWSGTLIDKRTKKTIEQLEFKVSDFIELTEREIVERIFKETDTAEYDGLFERTRIELQANLDDIRELAANIDKSLVNMVESQGKKLNFQVDKIREKIMNALKNSDKQMKEKCRRTSNTISPGNKPQERVFTILNYLLRYGREFPEFLIEKITTETDKHHIVEI
ncbi:MAG: bacillithiol biosynthesis cysteine-adding enzyme BshC [bacterium]|nr:bacillithiol biosynthesis cysteine-adding enzyme BshC [bacterium]